MQIARKMVLRVHVAVAVTKGAFSETVRPERTPQTMLPVEGVRQLRHAAVMRTPYVYRQHAMMRV